MPGRNESFSANDLLLIDHVTPKRKTVDGRYCRHALELPFHIDVPLYLVAALIIWYPCYHFIYVKTLKFLHERPALQSSRCIRLHQIAVYWCILLRTSDIRMEHFMKLAGHVDLFIIATQKKMSQPISISRPLYLAM